MIEGKVFIKNKITGILTRPKEDFFTGNTAAVMLHGFASDKNESACKNAYAILAENLAKKNIISLRIDFNGWGENLSISQEESTIDTMISDAIDAFEYLKNFIRDPKINIGYIGFSLGAAISILAARKMDKNCKFLGLLSPVGDLQKDFEGFLGKENYTNLMSCTDNIKIKLPWKHIRLGKDFAISLCRHDIRSELSTLLMPLICIAGSDDFSAVHAEYFIKKTPKENSKLIIYNKTDHCLNAFSENIMLYDAIDKLSQWIKALTF